MSGGIGGGSAGARRIAALLLACLLGGAGAGCGPIGPIPGGALGGEVVEAPVSDWSFTNAVETVQLETRPDDPYSVNTWSLGEGDRLDLATSLIRGDADPTAREWVRNVLADDRVRLRVGGRIYPLRAVRVTDPQELEEAREGLLAKYHVDRDAHAAAAWIFRLEPR